MEKMHQSIEDLWQEYQKTHQNLSESSDWVYEAWYFCDNEQDANELAELVLQGTKRGTASLHLLYELEKEELPSVGDHSVITNWAGTAKCIIRNKNVYVLPFHEVSEELAGIEGEGDGSLAYWRKVHLEVFQRTMESIGRSFQEGDLVVFEEFDVVYP